MNLYLCNYGLNLVTRTPPVPLQHVRSKGGSHMIFCGSFSILTSALGPYSLARTLQKETGSLQCLFTPGAGSTACELRCRLLGTLRNCELVHARAPRLSPSRATERLWSTLSMCSLMYSVLGTDGPDTALYCVRTHQPHGHQGYPVDPSYRCMLGHLALYCGQGHLVERPTPPRKLRGLTAHLQLFS